MGHTNLIELASKARAFAYAPYSKFAVGAAVVTKSGKIFTGCNIENISFGSTICAERCAVAAANMKVFAATVGGDVQESELAELLPLPGQGVLEGIRHV